MLLQLLKPFGYPIFFLFPILFSGILHAQNPAPYWPGTTLTPFGISGLGTGDVLSDGTFFSIGGYANIPGIAICKLNPDGVILKTLNHNFSFSQGLNSQYDPKAQRIFLTSTEKLNLAFATFPYNVPEQVAVFSTIEYRKKLIVCLDTAGNIIWSKKLEIPQDSLGAISLSEPDGTGGVFIGGHVLGSISGAVLASTASGQMVTLAGGYYFVTRFDRYGNQAWTIKVPDPPFAPVRKPTGVMHFVSQKNHTVDWLMYYASLENHYNIPQFATEDCVRLLRCRLDTNGNISRRFESPYNGRFMPTLYWAEHPIHKSTTGNKNLLYLEDYTFAPTGFMGSKINSAILDLDSNFSIRKIIRLPIIQLFGEMLLRPNGEILVEGKDQLNFSKKHHYLIINPETYQNTKVFSYETRCFTAYNSSKHLFNLHPANQQDSSDLLIFGPTGVPLNSKLSSPWFRLKNDYGAPCTGLKENLSAFPPNLDVTNLASFDWQPSLFLTSKSILPQWKDSLVAAPIPATLKPLVDVCKPIGVANGLEDQITICADTVRLKLSDFLYGVDDASLRTDYILWSTGEENQKSIVVNQSGKYYVTLMDTCGVVRVYKDSIQVNLLKDVRIERPADFTLCPGATKTTGTEALPGFNAKWSPSRGLNNPFLQKPTFIADSLPVGNNRFILTVDYLGTCPIYDTLMVYKSPGPRADVLPENPDSVLFLSKPYSEILWTVNGGFFQSQQNQDTVSIMWVQYFEGQQAGATFKDSLGCPGRAVYIRPKPQVPEEPDTVVVIPIMKPFQFPNLVTLNQDGKNERFEIKNLEESDVVELEVYNRWGRRIFQSENYRREFPDEGMAGIFFCKFKITGIRNRKIIREDKMSWIEVLGP